MNDQCEKVIATILSADRELPDDVAAHLQDCKECRRLSDEWRVLRDTVGELTPPRTVDRAIQAAARRRRCFHLVRRTIVKTFYLTAAAACIMMVFGVFFFSDRGLQSITRRVPGLSSPLLSWRSGFDRHMFEVDTEIEINREMINLGPDRSRQDALDVLLPLPASVSGIPESIDFGDDNDFII